MADASERPAITHSWLETTTEDLVRQVDAAGGWPSEAMSLKFYHTVEKDNRPCKFFKDAHNNEWWTVVLTPDQYHWQKLSDARKLEFKREVLREAAKRIMV